MVTGLTALFVWLKGRNAERDPASSAMVVSPEGAAARPVVLVDVRRETIGNLENGKYNPSLKLAMDIAKIFDTTVEDIFTFEDSDDE